MPRSTLVGLLFESWNDFDQVLSGITSDDAVKPHFGGSPFAWTHGHVANQIDTWVNVRFAGRVPHPTIGNDQYRSGGPAYSGRWEIILDGVREVRHIARDFLEHKTDEDLEIVVPYEGSFEHLRASGVNLRYALYRTITHHFFHLGEVATKRDMLGQSVGDYPRHLRDAF